MTWYIYTVRNILSASCSLFQNTKMLYVFFDHANNSFCTYQGEDLQREDTVSFPFFRRLDEDYTPSQLIFKDELIQSEAIKPPQYPNPGRLKVLLSPPSRTAWLSNTSILSMSHVLPTEVPRSNAPPCLFHSAALRLLVP